MKGISSIFYTIAQPDFSPVIYNAHGHARGHAGCASSSGNLDAGTNGTQSRGYDHDHVWNCDVDVMVGIRVWEQTGACDE